MTTKQIFEYLVGLGFTEEGVAGLMGNLKAESNLNPKNLQNTFEKSLAMTDIEYTKAVDAGTYDNFVRDSAGYGLAQWTYWSRKQALLEYAKSCGLSIGDCKMQLDFLFKELQGYKAVFEALKTTLSIKEASDIVLLKYERPANHSETVKQKRFEYAKKIYDECTKKESEASCMSNLFIICGHGDGDPGACGNGYQEAERVRTLAARIEYFGGNAVTIGDTTKNWYKDKLVNSKNIPKGSLVLELHMDSASTSAKGAHVIIDADFSADEYDKALAEFITGIFPGRSEKISKRNNLANPNRAQAAGINYRLLECGFISNAGDVQIFNSKMDDIAKGILKSFGITPKEEEKTIVEEVMIDYAQSKDKKYIGEYIVNSPEGTLSLRSGANTSKALIATAKTGEKVQCYGYFTKEADGTIWLFVKYKEFTGFMSLGYLKATKSI